VVFYWLLELVRDGNVRLLWLLPPLTVLWTNLHGGFFVGIALTGAYAAGELASGPGFPARSPPGRTATQQALPLATADVRGQLDQPVLYHLHVHIFGYLTEPYQFMQIQEFMPMSFSHPRPCSGAPLLLAVLAVAWNFTEALHLRAAAGWRRAIGADVGTEHSTVRILAAPLAPSAGSGDLERGAGGRGGLVKRSVAASSLMARKWPNRTRRDASGGSVAAILLLLWMVQLPGRPLRCGGIRRQGLPVKAVAALSGQRPVRLFTGSMGDTLYTAFSSTKVFVDGRSDFYGREVRPEVPGSHGW